MSEPSVENPVDHGGGLLIVGYISGVNRDPHLSERSKSHTYAITSDGDYIPMCEYGWNRSDGERFSIWRGHGSPMGHCKICDKREAVNAHPILQAKGHPTKLL